MILALALYIFFGLVVGIMAGLLGVGGGVILVPILNFTLSLEGITSEYVHHLALGTSMASIIFTSINSTLAHNKRGSVRWDVVKAMAPGLIIGTFGGTFWVAMIPARPLKIVFAVFLVYAAFQMISNVKPKTSFPVPGKIGLGIVGLFIGVLSSFVGIGGGALSIPFMVMCGIPMTNVIGISAALGFCIALSGVLGFAINGLNVTGLPPYTLGFVYLPALIGLVGASLITVPLGVRLSYKLPVPTLKRFFGIFLCCMAARMVYSVL